MPAKLAISFITYNRAKHINEDLEKIALPTQKKGIDIYIFDGSTDNKTERVVKKYIEKGYKHIFYYHYESDVESTHKRVVDAMLLPDAEYIWFCGDKFVIAPQNYGMVMKYIELSYDIITIYGKPIKCTKTFNNPVEYIDYSIIPLTHFGSTIIKKELIRTKNITKYRQYFPAFWIIVMFMKAIDKTDFKGVTIHKNENQLKITSRFQTKSGCQSDMWNVWIKCWYHAIMNAPKRYENIKKKIINRPDKDMNFFELKELMRQRSEGQFDLKKCIEYRKYFPKVIVLPRIVVYVISVIPKRIAKEILNFI